MGKNSVTPQITTGSSSITVAPVVAENIAAKTVRTTTLNASDISTDRVGKVLQQFSMISGTTKTININQIKSNIENIGFLALIIKDPINEKGCLSLISHSKIYDLNFFTMMLEHSDDTVGAIDFNTSNGVLKVVASKNISVEIKSLKII
jgi:hypothetical protein